MGENFFIFLFLAILLVIGSVHQNCEPITVDCACGTGENATILQLKLHAIVDTLQKTDEVQCSGYPDSQQACANISCSLISKNKERHINDKNVISNFYSKEFTILAEDVHSGHRFKREDEQEACVVKPLSYANIKCWQWPKWIKCDVQCVSGHAMQLELKTVRSVTITCRSSENNWKPVGFIDCQPYMNCMAQLVNPGDLKCHRPVDAPAYCDISCHAHEQHEAIANKRYECVDDNFHQILPHCAGLNEFVHLVDKPQ